MRLPKLICKTSQTDLRGFMKLWKLIRVIHKISKIDLLSIVLIIHMHKFKEKVAHHRILSGSLAKDTIAFRITFRFHSSSTGLLLCFIGHFSLFWAENFKGVPHREISSERLA